MASFDRRYAEAVAAEFARQPLGAAVPLVDADLDGLPAPVRRYIHASGAIGRPRPQNVRVAFDALMRWIGEQGRSPGGPMWEVYWTDPGAEPDPATWRTEVIVPLA